MQAFFRGLAAIHLGFFVCLLWGQAPEAVPKLEATGDTLAARTALARAVEASPNSIPALTQYAEFLERYGDPDARGAYRKLLTALRNSGNRQAAGTIARRLAVLDLLAGDDNATSADLDAYRLATGKQLSLATTKAMAEPWPSTTIPGPLRSFARMAAISPDASLEDLLPALARNVVTNGYQASHSNEALEQTEYLKLLHRYVSQARELEKLAGGQHAIDIASCDAPAVPDLLRILGFRMRGGCGSEVVLETVNAARAFLTTDSGFPVNDLEQALRTNRPFHYDYRSTEVPVLFGPEYWLGGAKDKESGDFLEAFLSDPSVCRLYLGMTKLERGTAESLRKGIPFSRLKVFAHVLDFFGGMFEIRDGKAVVPGGDRAAAAWADLAGVSPEKGAEFFDKLLMRDDGWLASLYDALARIHGPVQAYLTEPARLKRFYAAVKGKITTPGPARPVFRSNTDMMLLTTRLRLDPNGQPHIPGNLEVWKNLFVNHPQGKYDGKLTRLATTWTAPDDVLEALFALCRKSVENQPLKIFMALSDLDRGRATPLAPATVDRLAREFGVYGSQYSIFAESGRLSDASIGKFLDDAEAISKIHDPQLRSDAAGSFQSLIGLWQIMVRQRTIPESQADAAFAGIAAAFAQVRGDRELFDSSRAGLNVLLAAAPAKTATTAAQPQERLMALLSGASDTADPDVRGEMEQELGRILEAQHILSLDLLFDVADHLAGLGKGGKLNTALIAKFSGQVRDIPLPRASLTSDEKNAMTFGYWTDKHIEAERRLNVRAAIEKAGSDAQKLNDIRGQMAPLLRDTLLAFNYAYYAPPGAQILYTNPSFARSHDFIGMQGTTSYTWRATEPYGSGWPSNAGGRLVGSLSTLPYALAEAEENFLVPTQTQALIWGDLVPQMILSAKIPRWWNVSPAQVHWVGLHIRYGRELLAEAAIDPAVRQAFLDALGVYSAPVRTAAVASLIAQGDVKAAAEHVTPSELYSVAQELAPRKLTPDSCLLAEIGRLRQSGLTYEEISHAFGTPKPTLANSYEPELLGLRTFPALMGYSSRILAESWESNTLFWAALADEVYVSPAQLNVRIPEWTRKLVEQIFASHLEDWPALLKSLRTVGDHVRVESRAAMAAEKASVEDVRNR